MNWNYVQWNRSKMRVHYHQNVKQDFQKYKKCIKTKKIGLNPWILSEFISPYLHNDCQALPILFDRRITKHLKSKQKKYWKTKGKFSWIEIKKAEWYFKLFTFDWEIWFTILCYCFHSNHIWRKYFWKQIQIEWRIIKGS